MVVLFFFFFKQKTAYEMRISDWSSDVCSSDLAPGDLADLRRRQAAPAAAVELLQLGEGHVVEIEVESHADGVGGDQVVDLAGLEERALGVERARGERAPHPRSAGAPEAEARGRFGDLGRGEGDHRRTRRQT